MRCKSGILFSLMLGFLLTFSSCVKDNQIDQTTTVEPFSIITSDLMLSSIEEPYISNKSLLQEQMILIDTTHLELNNSNFVEDDLVKTNLTFQFANSLNRDFKIAFEFLNDKDELKFELQIPVSAGTKEKVTTVETNVTIETSELATFIEATKLVYKITLLPSDESQLPENDGSLELQSGATYFFDI